ncbi:MAG: mannose-1-phosphate guanylyltransferase/mannose-6-phosphate isomerase [Rubrivivax sp.]
MSDISVQPVIIAGGSGTRLWPLSRAAHPKQFLVFSGEHSLFQQAAVRLGTLVDAHIRVAPPCVVGNEEHRFLAADQLAALPATANAAATILLEPVGRNTAPAMTLAALFALQDGHDPVLVVTPADHRVGDEAAFAATLKQAVQVAAGGAVVILGITPDHPETGYGYVRCEPTATPSMAVLEFVEKPDEATAIRYLQQGGYYWNSGMFVMRASLWLQALTRFRPDIATATRLAWDGRSSDGRFVRPDRVAFAAIPSESVDYAVMEKCPGADGIDIRMLPLAADWSDLGAWDAVWQHGSKDAQGNVSHGDVLLRDTRHTLVHATSRLVGVVGLDNVVVIETPDAVLVADRSRSQDVKHIVNRLQGDGRHEHTLHRQVHRPWGWYDSVDSGPRFQVKRIVVKPGASLSLQKHHHRAEHWIVVSGTAEVTNGDKVILLSENQSTYIPLGQVHRLANPGKVPLEIIEVQSGSYLGEDDIVRFEDSYGRG